MFDFFYAPTDGLVKPYGAFIAHGRDGFEVLGAGFFAVRFEGGVQESGDAAASKVWVNAYEMDVSREAVGRDEPKQKSHHSPLELDDPGQLSEFVEINGMGQRARGTTPPTINDAHDVVEIGFFEGSTGQIVHGASGPLPDTGCSSVPASQDGAKVLRVFEKVVGTWA